MIKLKAHIKANKFCNSIYKLSAERNFFIDVVKKIEKTMNRKSFVSVCLKVIK
jgi:hypothetical protein